MNETSFVKLTPKLIKFEIPQQAISKKHKIVTLTFDPKSTMKKKKNRLKMSKCMLDNSLINVKIMINEMNHLLSRANQTPDPKLSCFGPHIALQSPL